MHDASGGGLSLWQACLLLAVLAVTAAGEACSGRGSMEHVARRAASA